MAKLKARYKLAPAGTAGSAALLGIAMLCAPAGAAAAAQLDSANSAETGAVPGEPVPNQAAWGLLASLAGTTWFDGIQLNSYAWVVPGEEMEATVLTPEGQSTNKFLLSVNGDVVNFTSHDGKNARVAQGRPGITLIEYVNLPIRQVMRFTGDTILVAMEEMKDGLWVESMRTPPRTRVTDVQIAEQSAKIRGKIAEHQQAADQDRKIWGDLKMLRNRYFVGSQHNRETVMMFKDKKIENKTLSGFDSFVITNQNFDDNKWANYNIFIYYDSNINRIMLSNGYGSKSDKIFVQNDGSVVFHGMQWRLHPNGNLETTIGKYDRVTSTFTPSQQPYVWSAYSAEKDSQRLASLAQARAAKKGGGGLFGTLVGAAVGAGVAAVGGMNTSDTLGVIAKGAAATSSDGGTAAALNATSDSFLGGSKLTSGVGSTGSGGAINGGGAYATKPNLAVSSCSGFSESNYRQRALQGGGDSQLFTMCGQAFEYYTMYKRAIAQGYSEADANRTYAAHEQSARVASGYLSSHGAN
jgi:hypothetical protein